MVYSEYLASLSFAPSESAILYTAEGKTPETNNPFEKFRFNPDFGEGLVGKKRPVTFILRWDSSHQYTPSNRSDNPKLALTELKSEENIRFGQAVFSPNSDNIIYATGYELTLDGRMLGVNGCYNRPTGIWHLALPDQLSVPELGDKLNAATAITVIVNKLTSASLSCRSPRTFKRHGECTLTWLACPTGGPHVGTAALYCLNISSNSTTSFLQKAAEKALISITKDGIPPSPLPFPGLYPSYNLPSSPTIVTVSESASESVPFIVVHSQWGSRTTVLLISIKDGTVTELSPASEEEGLYSWTVLATDGRSRVICQRSSPSMPYEILLGHLDDTGRISWHLIDKPDLPKHSKLLLHLYRNTHL